MQIEKVNYKFLRGDTSPLKKFRFKDTEGNILELTENDEIHFTIKNEATGQATVKKSLTNGIEKDEEGYYHITLEAEDTQDLELYDAENNEINYKYDIECILKLEDKNFVVTPIMGKIKFEKDVTEEGDRN